jgi:hypothetical protein
VTQTTCAYFKWFVRTPSTGRGARSLGLAFSLLCLGGPTACARQVVHVPEAIGPNPLAAPQVNKGRLVVYTEERPAPYDDNQATIYSPYTVLDSSHQVLLEVDNASGADVVALSPGQYTIRIDASPTRTITVPVRIVARRTTEAHLDGKWKAEGVDQRILIRGPDGSLVGFRADLSMNADGSR